MNNSKEGGENMDGRISKIETRVEALEDDFREIKAVSTDFGTRITALEKTTILIERDLTHILSITGEIRNDLKNLRALRDKDHFIDPIERHRVRNEKVVWAVVGGILSALVAALAAGLLTLI